MSPLPAGWQGISVRFDGVQILDDISLEAPAGQTLGILGPNGSGKSTLLRTLYRSVRPSAGRALLGDLDVWHAPVRTVARTCAVLTQEHAADVELSVRDLVALGRIPHVRGLPGKADRKIVERALDETETTELADRMVDTLSGGERQRVLLARALAQQPKVLLLDEPTNHLDVRHQLDLLQLVRQLGVTTVLVLHDLTLAATWCDRLAVLHKGRLVADGTPADVLTPEQIQRVWQVGSTVLAHPVHGRPLIALDPSPSERPTS